MTSQNSIKEVAQLCYNIQHAMQKRIVGQNKIVQRVLMALLCQGHILLEGLPGLAKTTIIKTLGEATGLHMKRIQFTPDLLPADVTGTQIYNPQTGAFQVRKGAVFANLLLADEINRAPAKVQSALLQAMEERLVTLGEETFTLEEPFLVMATQNPIEQEGTYPLPEAQLDRFLFKVILTYGTQEEEQQILSRAHSAFQMVIDQVASQQDILNAQKVLFEVAVAEKVRKYITDIVFATRFPAKYSLAEYENKIRCGASPRASLNLEKAAKANAILDNRSYITPQDIKDVAFDILRHRILLSYEAEAENITQDMIIAKILETVDVP